MRRTLLSLSLLGALAVAPLAFAQSSEVAPSVGVAQPRAAVVTLTPASNSATSLAVSPTTVDAGRLVDMNADVQPTQGGPTPFGTVTFYYGGLSLGSAQLVANRAKLVVNTRTFPKGTYAITAHYGGDQNYQPSVSQAAYFSVVSVTNSSVSMSASPSSVAPGNPLTVIADVQPTQGGPNATGYVLFFAGTQGQIYLGSAPVWDTNAAMLVPTAGVPAGSYPLYAIYLGDSNYNPSISQPTWVYVQ